MLKNVTPIQATETTDEDSWVTTSSSDDSIDGNLPTKWALWKLGTGESYKENFVEGEAFLSYIGGDTRTQAMKRTEKSKRRLGLARNRRTIFVPKRPEL
ncbi:hypothetical protein SARC_08634 [Sphaeroforma arctica JP610]|uniref:Uncharacterized protein n=1 Tax=Sphaeroforma arctica JP610 TaxID=667725 RepID=A0A0L0FQY3_9EUKA|nr:hypothetical protein SARC_08634 [Sphaeroforma arctica JP610]KNC78956.1 hypothetical protein SARC_08634 [Sphaeroforma arctica JP610]|eukprot:XP_014152858.1 hypothetical protein SARC_08634 [Sphaeroforma arctica JP610]